MVTLDGELAYFDDFLGGPYIMLKFQTIIPH